MTRGGKPLKLRKKAVLHQSRTRSGHHAREKNIWELWVTEKCADITSQEHQKRRKNPKEWNTESQFASGTNAWVLEAKRVVKSQVLEAESMVPIGEVKKTLGKS